MFRFKAGFLLLITFILSSCEMDVVSSRSSFSDGSSENSLSNNSYSSSESTSALKPIKIYDIYLDNADPQPFSFVLEEFDDQTFNYDKQNKITNKTYGTVVNYASAVYAFDANNDGYRDFCIVNSDGSGAIYWYVTVYDLHNQKEIFKHWERPRFSYFLLLRDNNLYVKQVNDYYSDETINEGELSFDKDKGVYIKWNKNYDIADFDVKISFADPQHTPVTIDKQKDAYNVTVDNASQYFFDIDIHTNIDYGKEYLPVSFAMPAKSFSVFSVFKTDSLQRYNLYFTDYSSPECIALITISNITKTFIFSVRSSNSYQTLKDVISWSKDVSADNMTMFESEFETKRNIPTNSFRQITRYHSQSAFSKALSNFDQVAFEISPEDFGFLNKDFQVCHTYRFYVGEQVQTYQSISTFVESNGKWYKVRSILSMGYYDGNENLFAFPSNTPEVTIYHSNDVGTGKSANYLTELLFAKTTMQENTMSDVQFYFVINDVKYCILSSKTFTRSDENYRYLYTITSSKDFSNLF